VARILERTALDREGQEVPSSIKQEFEDTGYFGPLGEERELTASLPGYRDYIQGRPRLIPHIW
jgi:hypothetical protein